MGEETEHQRFYHQLNFRYLDNIRFNTDDTIPRDDTCQNLATSFKYIVLYMAYHDNVGTKTLIKILQFVVTSITM
jgi:hypothetical protein